MRGASGWGLGVFALALLVPYGPASVFETLRKSPVLEDIWQGHMALGTPKEIITDERMIANMEPTAECTGNLLKLSVAPNGTYTMTNLRNGFSKSYRAK